MASKQNTELFDQTLNGSELNNAPMAQSRFSQLSRVSRFSKTDKRNLTELELNTLNGEDNVGDANDANKPKAVTRIIDVEYQPIIATGHDDSTFRLWNESVS